MIMQQWHAASTNRYSYTLTYGAGREEKGKKEKVHSLFKGA